MEIKERLQDSSTVLFSTIVTSLAKEGNFQLRWFVCL